MNKIQLASCLVQGVSLKQSKYIYKNMNLLACYKTKISMFSIKEH